MMRFLEDLKSELLKRKMNQNDIEDIIKDHEEMIQEALREGLSEEDIVSRFGDPKTLAKELASECPKEEERVIHEDYTLWKSLSLTRKEMNILINLVSEDLIVQSSEDDQAHLFYKGEGDIDNYVFMISGDELKLEAPKSRGLIFMRSMKDDLDFILELPKDVKINEWKHQSESSDVQFNVLEAQNFKLSTTSGDIEIMCGSVKNMKLNTVSGDLQLSNLNVDDIDLSMVSGDVSINQSVIKGRFYSNTVSGDLNFEDTVAQQTEFRAVSGDVEGKEFYPKTVTFKSVSGDFIIRNKEKTNITSLSSSSLSGEVSIKP